jgi:hypothetical protein
MRAGLRDCRLGDGDPITGMLGRLRLDGPYEQTLPTVETRRLYLTTLIPPLIAVASASRSHCCVADQAGVLLDVVLDAHARATDHWARKRRRGPWMLYRLDEPPDDITASALLSQPLEAHESPLTRRR